jgi:hypothetical protein
VASFPTWYFGSRTSIPVMNFQFASGMSTGPGSTQLNQLIWKPSFFWTALDVTGIVTALLAFALLHLDGVHGISGWR